MPTFYRVIRQRRARRSDFTSDLANGLPPRPLQRQDPLTWAGVSVYGTYEDAVASARGFRIGEWVAELSVPDAGSFHLRQTTRKLTHYSLAGDPALLVSYVARVLPVPFPAITEVELTR